MKQPPCTLFEPLRCFFSTLNAQRMRPSSSMRCQNGPLLLSKASRLQVRQPANSPSVPTWRSGRLRNADLASSSTAGALQIGNKAVKSDLSPWRKPRRRVVRLQSSGQQEIASQKAFSADADLPNKAL